MKASKVDNATMSAAARKAMDLRQKVVAVRRQVNLNDTTSPQVVHKPQRLGTRVSLAERQAAGSMIQQASMSSTALQVRLVQDGEEVSSRCTHASPTTGTRR